MTKKRIERVTLLACIPCHRMILNAFVMCADSQETVTEYDEQGNGNEYRRTVQKIEPINIGDVQIVVAGSGDTPLILSFITKLERKLTAAPCTSVNQFVSLAENLLKDFYQTTAPLAGAMASLSMFIAASFKSTGEFGVWLQVLDTLTPVKAHVLTGWRETLYVKIADRVCTGDLTVEQATLAGIHILSVAESTSNYVRGPMSVVIIDNQGIRTVDSDYVKDMADRVTKYDSKLNKVFLACADSTVLVPDLEDRIDEFKQAAVDLHRDRMKARHTVALSLEEKKLIDGVLRASSASLQYIRDSLSVQPLSDSRRSLERESPTKK